MARTFRRRLLAGVAAAFAIAVVLAATILTAPTAAGAHSPTERIDSYDAQIAIQPDGSIFVTEHITYDFGSDERHGIFRVIPVRVRYNGSYDRVYPVEVLSVESDTDSEYTVESTGSGIGIKIGDPNQTVTGVHAYWLTYMVRGGLNGFADHDELYWNAVGNRWDVPIDQVSVQVSAPAGVTRAACLAGLPGSTDACEQAVVTDEGAQFSHSGLGPGEGLTVVVAIPKGVVTSPGPILRERWSMQRAFALTPVSAGATGGLLAVLAVLVALVLARGRDRRYLGPAVDVVRGTPVPADVVGRTPVSTDVVDRVPVPTDVVDRVPVPADDAVSVPADDAVPPPGCDEPATLFAPPPGVRPGQAGTLLDGVANPRDVTGTIADLAVRGYLRIEDAALDQTARHAEPNPPWEESTDWRLTRLDKTGGLLNYEQILLDGLFQDAATSSGRPSTRLAELGPGFAGRLQQAQDALYADVARRGWFTARPDRVRRRWLIIGGALFTAGTAAVAVAAAYSHLALIPVPVAVAGLVLIVCARWMPVRTAKGTDLARQLFGFRNYLTTTAAGPDRPAGEADLLDDYLPYAIVFGCAKQWAELSMAVADADRSPSWYRTSGPYSPDSPSTLSRSARYFSPIHQFATTTNTWIATHSTSSGGSGSSGFSGGGFSGGGGGGGGGGSW
jgi:uncharacterized membrane protein YgcG